MIERRRGEERLVRVKARPYSALQAAQANARTVDLEGRPVGYVHFWFVHSTGVAELLRELFAGSTELVGLPMKGPYVQKASAPNRSVVVMHLGDLVVRQGFDGKTAWSDTPMTGKQILAGPAADMMRRQAQFYGPLDLMASSKEIAVTGFANFDGHDCVELKVVGQGSGRASFLYVDAETGLTAGTKFMLETPLGLIETKTFARNYRDFNGYRTATEIYVESSLQRQLIKIDKVSFDEIPVSEYALPADAK